jgi:predicted dehydrogenase
LPHPILGLSCCRRLRRSALSRLFPQHSQLLECDDLDAVYVNSDNRESAELAVEAARRGLHVMVEKPMAADLAGAVDMQNAASESGVQLMINWPFAWRPALQHALRMALEGRIGRVFQINYRAAHGGPREVGCSEPCAEWLLDATRNGGGALIDYCSYGSALVCHLLGLPARVTAVSGRLNRLDMVAEDNAVLIMENDRAISTATASWTQAGHLTSYVAMIYGTEASLVVQGNDLLRSSVQHPDGMRLEVDPPDPTLRSSTTFFLDHIRTGEPIAGLCSASVGLATQEVLEAGMMASQSRCSVELPLGKEPQQQRVGQHPT